MYFKKLELLGFKSFAEKTVLNFEPGVTAIVGPNGCGKSNIFDGIRWVLGEQSVKAMRGTSMEDVIFNGTETKPALGFAEVSLTFSNEAKLFPIDYEEITITRRLFRSGESEYILNKSPVRLKDINELLMGTGVASESYSLVEQGKIDLVLSSRPEDRRAIFDEAAGITKYKAKKKEALSKLEYTEENLLRLSDIISEVKRQIGSLERQVAKARRYQTHFEKLKEIEVKKACFELKEFKQERVNLASQKGNYLKQQKEKEQSKASQISQMQDLESEQLDIVSNIETAEKDTLTAENSRERFTDQIRVSKERISEYQQRIESLLGEESKISVRIQDEKVRLESVKQEFDSFDNNAGKKQNQLELGQQSLEEILLKINASRQLINESKKGILDTTSHLAEARNDTSKINSEFSTFSARKRRLNMEKVKVGEEKQLAEENFVRIETDLKQRRQERDSLTEQLSKENSNQENQQSAFIQMQDSLIRLEKDLSGLQSQKEFLENLKSKYTDFSDVSDAVLFLDIEGLKPGMGFLGKVKTVEEAGADLENNFSFHKKPLKKINCHLKVIDLDLDQINKKEAEISNNVKGFKAKKEELSGLIKSTSALINEKEAKLKQSDISLENIKTQFDILKTELDKLNEEGAIVDVELGEVEAEISSLEESVSKSRENVTRFEAEEKRLGEMITTNQDLIAEFIDRREKTTVEIAQLETILSSLSQRRADLENSMRIIESSLAQDENRKRDLDFQRQLSKQRIEALLTEIKRLEAQIQTAESNKIDTAHKLQGLGEKRSQLAGEIRERQEQIDTLSNEINSMRESEFQLSSKEQEINYKILTLKDRIQSSYQIVLDDIQEPALETADLASWQEEIDQIRKKLDSYGTVNLVAIEEHEELKKRFEFLTNQQNDLLSAKDSIHKAILKINQTTKKMFKETFVKIAEHFKSYFKLLFNGGGAQLFLSDENDILESGIEIICRPPGKKLQNISLLSGGEKALSAIALIFAVFKVKPSPFCVLDEIDAALDESNIDRYNRVLQDFVKTSQFIIITHNKKTITNADVMYGITMQESGVSKIVSVKFAKEEKAQEPKSKSPKLRPLEEQTSALQD